MSNPFGLVVQMTSAWNDQMTKEWAMLAAGRTAPGLVKPDTMNEAMERGLRAEHWRNYWYTS